MPGKAAGDGSSTWVPETHTGVPDGIHGSRLWWGTVQPQLLQLFGEWTSRWKVSFSLCLPLCVTLNFKDRMDDKEISWSFCWFAVHHCNGLGKSRARSFMRLSHVDGGPSSFTFGRPLAGGWSEASSWDINWQPFGILTSVAVLQAQYNNTVPLKYVLMTKCRWGSYLYNYTISNTKVQTFKFSIQNSTYYKHTHI